MYTDADNHNHYASKYPQIVLKAKNSNQIKKAREYAIENNIHYVDFTDAMTIGTYTEQLEKSRNTKHDDLEYYGIAMFGDQDQINAITKKYSIYL